MHILSVPREILYAGHETDLWMASLGNAEVFETRLENILL